jgi:CRP/FNR family cyclic AMP-dependent transcriptional regulator
MSLILYIEDNKAIRENAVEILEMHNYTVITAVDGQQGVALALEKLPHLIICDVIMPVLDGYQTIQQIKSHPALASIPFMFVTASAQKSEMSRGLTLGANAYIRKPFDTLELLDTVKQLLAISAK